MTSDLDIWRVKGQGQRSKVHCHMMNNVYFWQWTHCTTGRTLGCLSSALCFVVAAISSDGFLVKA